MKRPLLALLFLSLILGALTACNLAKPPKNAGRAAIDYSASDFTPASCGPGGAAQPLGSGNWAAGMPAAPDEAVVIIDPGHGGRDGGACIAVPGNGACGNRYCTAELKAAGASSLIEAELTFTAATRLQALLERLGFKVGLTRRAGYGKRGLSVSATLSGQNGSYQGSAVELALRGWKCYSAFWNIKNKGCPWRNLAKESRVSQLLG